MRLKHYGRNETGMKRNVKTLICFFTAIALALVILIIIIAVGNISSGKIAEGTYRIRNCSEFPDAYIVVKGNKVQFYDIDLNKLYREKELESFKGWVEHGVGVEMTEKQIEKASDLNELFVTHPWEIDYDIVGDNKDGTFTYIYFCIVKDTPFGLVLQYDSLHKTIQLNNSDPQKIFVFKKAWFQ